MMSVVGKESLVLTLGNMGKRRPDEDLNASCLDRIGDVFSLRDFDFFRHRLPVVGHCKDYI